MGFTLFSDVSLMNVYIQSIGFTATLASESSPLPFFTSNSKSQKNPLDLVETAGNDSLSCMCLSTKSSRPVDLVKYG